MLLLKCWRLPYLWSNRKFTVEPNLWSVSYYNIDTNKRVSSTLKTFSRRNISKTVLGKKTYNLDVYSFYESVHFGKVSKYRFSSPRCFPETATTNCCLWVLHKIYVTRYFYIFTFFAHTKSNKHNRTRSINNMKEVLTIWKHVS